MNAFVHIYLIQKPAQVVIGIMIATILRLVNRLFADCTVKTLGIPVLRGFTDGGHADLNTATCNASV